MGRTRLGKYIIYPIDQVSAFELMTQTSSEAFEWPVDSANKGPLTSILSSASPVQHQEMRKEMHGFINNNIDVRLALGWSIGGEHRILNNFCSSAVAQMNGDGERKDSDKIRKEWAGPTTI